MSFFKFYIVFTIIWVVFLIASNVFFIYTHESVHKEIFRQRGVNSTITIFNITNPFASPECTPTTNYSAQTDKEMQPSHDLTDIVGYHIQAFWVLLCFAIWIIVNLLVWCMYGFGV